MNKIKMLRGAVVGGFPRVWSLGYCRMGSALSLMPGPCGYNSGVYGWNYDIYDVGGVAVCTGYRDMPGAGVPAAFVEKWEKRAKRVCALDWSKFKRARARFVRDFGAAFAALRLPRVEFVRGRAPVVPSWADRVRVVRGGAWFYEYGAVDVEGARALVFPRGLSRSRLPAGLSFVLMVRDYKYIAVPVCKCLSDKTRVCSAGAGCFYYLGLGDIGAAAGRALCGCNNGRYDSGAAARYVERLSACPCGRWVNGK